MGCQGSSRFSGVVWLSSVRSRRDGTCEPLASRRTRDARVGVADHALSAAGRSRGSWNSCQREAGKRSRRCISTVRTRVRRSPARCRRGVIESTVRGRGPGPVYGALPARRSDAAPARPSHYLPGVSSVWLSGWMRKEGARDGESREGGFSRVAGLSAVILPAPTDAGCTEVAT